MARLRSFLIRRITELIGVRAALPAASVGITSASGWVIVSPVGYLQNQPERVNIDISLE